jgi:hypothetical protein
MPPDVHFTAPINAFSASSDGQQQRSTPLFGSGIWSISISTGQPVIGVPTNRLLPTLSLTATDGKKISVLVAFGRSGSDASTLVATLSDVFAAGVVERRLLSDWSFQQWLEPCR